MSPKAKKTDYAQMQKGFAKLDFYDNGDVWLEFFTTTEESGFSGKNCSISPYMKKKRIEKYSE